ncbi:lytic transglycosylase domain-containing protein [Streptomyces sp. NPDC090303]|uniref:lytic transglycosylase domain-containing protein n=1 Tax=Streptomyces sp. NPDC090303 TaxID=3365960 RepID=UPI003801574C
MGLGIQKSSSSAAAAADASDEEGSQAVPRPFVAPTGTAIAPNVQPPAGGGSAQQTGLGLPTTVYHAYVNAQTMLTASQPTCRLTWPVLAGIGQVESNQAHNGAVDAAGNTLRPIVGPALDGDGFASVADTDGGRLDGDTRWDRAVGPMQFIPSTWAVWGADGNHDGVANPHNIFDAALSTGRYLCAHGRDLSDPKQLRDAILSYNRSAAYADTVTDWITRYAKAGADVPDSTASPSTGPSAGASRTPSGGPRTTPSPSPSPKRSTSPSPTPSRGGKTSSPPPSPSVSTPPPSPSPSASTPPPSPTASTASTAAAGGSGDGQP